jgi:hypothetical protein
MLLLLAFIPRDEDPLVKIVASLQRWTDTIPQEKVYLHMDKPYYALGDTIWFKGYITIGIRHQLSKLSGSLYVDLITEKDSVIRTLKLPITTGMVMGDFTLGDEFKEGSYRIRAYTQWMRNAGEDYFFDHTFTVGNIVSSNIITKSDYQYKDIDGKPVLTATLNYTSDDGKPLAGKDVHYQIMINKRVAWSSSAKTNTQGNLQVKISNENHVDLSGAYITTTLDGSDKNTITRDFPIKAQLSQSDVQFFPESGSLVNGITSRVAFKAVGVDGAGIAIKGTITDNENKEVAEIETLHAGMGSFLLRPEAGKTYSANIIFADGTTKTIALPKAINEGYVLSVYQPNKDSILVRIGASTGLQKVFLNLVAHTSGETIFASPIKIEKAITSIWLEKKAFPTGIAQFTIFNNNGEPLNERIAFIRSNDQLQLSLKTVKTNYKSKEHVLVNLDAKDSKNKPTFGNFSVTVIDESKVPVDESAESTIFSNILLTSDLKGYIEKPNYYFANETDEINKALDNLMMTQGYRRFTWKELNNTINTKPLFEAEGLGVNISGRVTTLGDKILPNATVNLISLRAKITQSTKTDANGRFRFNGIFLMDSIKFSLQARTAKNSDKVKLILDSIPKLQVTKNRNLAVVNLNINGTLQAYIDNGKKLDEIYEKTGQLNKVQRLKEVRIKAKKVVVPTYAMQGQLQIPEGHSDQTYKIPEPEHCATLGICLQGMLPGIIFKDLVVVPPDKVVYHEMPFCRQINGNQELMHIIVDGVLIRHLDEMEDIMHNNTILADDIVKIEVVKDNQALIAVLGGAAIMIYTNRGMGHKWYTPSMANITPKGFNKAREFYSPKYDRPRGDADKLPDLRSTIYWNPYLKTDVAGKTSFSFYNGDGPGTYKVIVEGINADGELGRQVYRYTVEEGQADSYVAPPEPSNNTAKFITDPLASFNKRLPVEKVYLHTDKPYYNIGDTLWFKSYLLDRASLTGSKLSSFLYVELDDDSTEMIKRIKIPIKDGMGWGQIPLTRKAFHEGGYTLRAYTNWMQNFGEDYVFNKRFYLGLPTRNTWLVKSNATINHAEDKDQLQVQLYLNRPDQQASPIALKKVEVRIYDDWHYLYKEELQTGIDGSLKFNNILPDKSDGRRIRVEIRSLEQADRNKLVMVPLTINRSQNIDLQFLPEGGKLVAGLKSVAGFKAIQEDGKGAPVTGDLYDSKGNKILSFTALHNGMGAFEFTPKANEAYTAKITQPVIKTFPLPMVNAVGTVMHVDNPENSESLTVTLSGLNSLRSDSVCYLIGTSRGSLYYSQRVDPNQPIINISKKLFPSGIARFTLFAGKRPLNERAVFIDNHDQLSIKVIPNKPTYLKHDSVDLAIEVKDNNGMPVQGNFSLAVTDDSQVKPDTAGNFGIAANLLINSELKGHIEAPGYYITRKDKQAWQALDNVMLTQGWTGYDWKTIFDNSKPIRFNSETDFKITGRVSNILNHPVVNAPVLISLEKRNFITTVKTDVNGIYTFKDLPVVDSGSYFIQASTRKGNYMHFGLVTVDRFKEIPIPETINSQVLPWYVNSDSTQINYVKRKIETDKEENIKLSGIVLKEVKIKEKKIIPGSMNPYGPGNADIILDEQDIKKSGVLNLYDLLKQTLPGFRVIGSRVATYLSQDINIPIVKFGIYAVDPIQIDGGLLPIDNMDLTLEEVKDELRKYKLSSIRGVEIAYSRKFTNKSALTEGRFRPYDFAKIEVTTYKGQGYFRSFSNNVVHYTPLAVSQPQQFYSPKYEVKPPAIIEPDYRSTLYWEPNITTDQSGRARVSFYTSDINGKYTVKIAGLNADGQLGDGTFKLNKAAHENN